MVANDSSIGLQKVLQIKPNFATVVHNRKVALFKLYRGTHPV